MHSGKSAKSVEEKVLIVTSPLSRRKLSKNLYLKCNDQEIVQEKGKENEKESS